MSRLRFQLAKFLNTFGFRHIANNHWNRAEQDIKKKYWNTSNFQNTYYINQGLLANKLEPKKQIISSLAEEKLYNQGKNFFDIFGFVSLRGILKDGRQQKIDDILQDLRKRSASVKTLYFMPIEKSFELQDILLTESFFKIVSKIIGPFWFIGSDAAVESNPFQLHRDTFFNPPVVKILVPTQPGIFQVLCGSHHPNDEFSRNAGSCICDWDRPNNLSTASSSLYFDSADNAAKIVGYDDSHQNPPLTNIPLNPGDVLIFNQNLVHGLHPIKSTISFIAFSVFASPENSRKFNMTRREHLDSIIKSTAVMMLVEKKLAASKNINETEIVYPGKAFEYDGLNKIIKNKKLKDYFGLFEIDSSTWQAAIQENSHASWEMLRNNL